jgi:fumarate reductase subunit C
VALFAVIYKAITMYKLLQKKLKIQLKEKKEGQNSEHSSQVC